MPLLPRKFGSARERHRTASALSLGYNFMGGMLLCTFLGYLADQKLGTGERWTLAGLFLGLLYGGYEVWKFVRLANESSSSPDEDVGEKP